MRSHPKMAESREFTGRLRIKLYDIPRCIEVKQSTQHFVAGYLLVWIALAVNSSQPTSHLLLDADDRRRDRIQRGSQFEALSQADASRILLVLQHRQVVGVEQNH